jgi:hypothetical protein
MSQGIDARLSRKRITGLAVAIFMRVKPGSARPNDLSCGPVGLIALVFLAMLWVTDSIAFGNDATFAHDIPPHALFQKYCFSCHGEDVDSPRLRLDQLKPDFADPTSFAGWVKVLDLVSTGEMPRTRKKRPSKQEVQALVDWLRPQLHAADLARVQTQGRVMFRRLNRFEYENTLHDLLAINQPLAHLLPEDGSAGGFDNVGAALCISSQLMERYLEAADVALKAADVETIMSFQGGTPP